MMECTLRFDETPYTTFRAFVCLPQADNFTKLPLFPLFEHTCLWGGHDRNNVTDGIRTLSWEFDYVMFPVFKKRFKNFKDVIYDVHSFALIKIYINELLDN